MTIKSGLTVIIVKTGFPAMIAERIPVIVWCRIITWSVIFVRGGGDGMDSYEKDFRTIENMEMFGGSFVKALALAARRADSRNLARIKKAFPDYWRDYSEISSTISWLTK